MSDFLIAITVAVIFTPIALFSDRLKVYFPS